MNAAFLLSVGRTRLTDRWHTTALRAITFSGSGMDGVGISATSDASGFEHAECDRIYWIRTTSPTEPFSSLADLYNLRAVADHWGSSLAELMCELSVAAVP